jgi:hypothetical protein
MCRQILRDEAAHVRFQCERMALLQEADSRLARWIKRFAHAALFWLTALVLWVGHRRVFRAAAVDFRGYRRMARRAFRRR